MNELHQVFVPSHYISYLILQVLRPKQYFFRHPSLPVTDIQQQVSACTRIESYGNVRPWDLCQTLPTASYPSQHKPWHPPFTGRSHKKWDEPRTGTSPPAWRGGRQVRWWSGCGRRVPSCPCSAQQKPRVSAKEVALVSTNTQLVYHHGRQSSLCKLTLQELTSLTSVPWRQIPCRISLSTWFLSTDTFQRILFILSTALDPLETIWSPAGDPWDMVAYTNNAQHL